MKISFSTFNFASVQLKSLMKTRSINGSVLRAFVDNLEKITSHPATPNFSRSEIGSNNSSKLNNMQRSRLTSIWHHVKMARKAIEQVKKGSKVAFYGIDPKRLDVTKTVSLRQSLHAHTAKSCPQTEDWFGPKIGEWCEVVFDPKSALSYKSVSDKTDLAVLSPFAMILIAVLRFWRLAPLRSIRTLFTLWRDLAPQYRPLKSKLAAVLLIWGFLLGAAALLCSAEKVKILCLTSNSTFLEALRALILGIPGGQAIEVLHGINSPIFDPYFLSYKKVLSNNQRGTFVMVPMLAAPFALPPESSGGVKVAATPSNTGILRALKREIATQTITPRQLRVSDADNIVDAILLEMKPHCLDGRAMFAILGGTDLDTDYYAGKAFKSEFGLLEMLRSQLAKKSIIPQFVYFQHPTNPPLDRLQFADSTEISLSSQTQLGYFCADYCLGLYSTSIFESAAFGAHVFSPLTQDTEMIYPQMLEAIVVPETPTQQSLDAAVMRFGKLEAPLAADQRTKIKGRVMRYLAGDI